MSARRRLAVFAAIVMALSGRGSAQEVPQGFAVEARADRPAAWVADRITYVVEITCPKGFDILTEDLDRQKLKLTALDVLASDSSRNDEAGGIHYRFRYVLTTYRVDAPVLAIAPFPVRYYASRSGRRPDQLSPAGILQIPGASVTLRSLLPDDQASSPVRDDRDVPPRRARYRLLGPAGLALIAVSLVPAVLSFVALVRRAGARRVRTQRTAREIRRNARTAVDELRALDVSGGDARTAAFAQLEAAVREHVTHVCGVAAAGMTPDELARALTACDVPRDAVAAALEMCERARYAPPDAKPGADEWRRTLDRAEEILGAQR